MITNKHIYKETKESDILMNNENATEIDVLKRILKQLTINTKLLLNIRTNMTTVMEYYKIPLKKSDEQIADQNKPEGKSKNGSK